MSLARDLVIRLVRLDDTYGMGADDRKSVRLQHLINQAKQVVADQPCATCEHAFWQHEDGTLECAGVCGCDRYEFG